MGKSCRRCNNPNNVRGGDLNGGLIYTILIIVITIIAAPILGGLLSGIDRIITARMQNRYGPPVLQPFYDFFKLMGKERITVNQTQMAYVIGHLFFAVTSSSYVGLRSGLIDADIYTGFFDNIPCYGCNECSLSLQ